MARVSLLQRTEGHHLRICLRMRVMEPNNLSYLGGNIVLQLHKTGSTQIMSFRVPRKIKTARVSAEVQRQTVECAPKYFINLSKFEHI